MATFEKKTWVDRVSEFPTRRTLTDVSTGTAQIVTVARTEGEVTNPGDAFNAQNMNDLEDRIDTVVQEMDANFQAGVDAVIGALASVGISIPAGSTPQEVASAVAASNRGAWTGTGTPTGNNQVNVAIPAGYHSGNGYVTCKGQSSYSAGASAKSSAYYALVCPSARYQGGVIYADIELRYATEKDGLLLWRTTATYSEEGGGSRDIKQLYTSYNGKLSTS